jgi:hypothetical protein
MQRHLKMNEKFSFFLQACLRWFRRHSQNKIDKKFIAMLILVKMINYFVNYCTFFKNLQIYKVLESNVEW